MIDNYWDRMYETISRVKVRLMRTAVSFMLGIKWDEHVCRVIVYTGKMNLKFLISKMNVVNQRGVLQ